MGMNEVAYVPSAAAAEVLARYDQINRITKSIITKSKWLVTVRSQQAFLADMLAMQRELIQAHLPEMGLEDALRAARTLDYLAAVDAAEAKQARVAQAVKTQGPQGGEVPAVYWDGRAAA